MRRVFSVALPVSALLLGLVGRLLHQRQMQDLEAATRLLPSGNAWSAALTVFLAVCALACLLAARLPVGGEAVWREKGQPGAPALSALLCAAVFLLAASGGLHLLECVRRYSLMRIGADYAYILLMKLLCALLSFAAAAVLFLLLQGRAHGLLPRGWQWMTTLPAYAFLPWLVSFYQDHSRQPELWLYALTILGGVCASLALYYGCGFAFKVVCPRRCLFFSLMGVILLLTAQADLDWSSDKGSFAVTSAAVLLLLFQCAALLAPAGDGSAV